MMAPTVIGPGFKITGHAVSDGEVQVDGEIEGDIECKTLNVGQSAKVTGNVVAESVTVQGKVMGSIRGANVTLQASSHIEGDVYHSSLAIEQGAFFEGKSRRSDNPVGDAPKLGDRSGPSANSMSGTLGDAKPSNGSGLLAG